MDGTIPGKESDFAERTHFAEHNPGISFLIVNISIRGKFHSKRVSAFYKIKSIIFVCLSGKKVAPVRDGDQEQIKNLQQYGGLSASHNEMISNTCKACAFPLIKIDVGSYAFCPSCGSANYSSNKTASEDNKEYFNSIYAKRNSIVIAQRKKQFEIYNQFNSLLHFKESLKFNHFLQKISSIILNSEKTLEVGFGSGDDLAKYIQAGANMYGIDLSEVAVKNFQQNYPAFKTRVSCSVTCDFPVDVIYSSAVLEHLDTPSEFLTNAFRMLKPGGRLITRLPLITGKVKDNRDIEFDINFWKPCHRILYTLKGLTLLFEKHNFKILGSSSLAYYGYKVMSRMMKLGYNDIVQVRNPYFKINALDSDFVYRKILLQSFSEKIICSDVAVLAAKID